MTNGNRKYPSAVGQRIERRPLLESDGRHRIQPGDEQRGTTVATMLSDIASRDARPNIHERHHRQAAAPNERPVFVADHRAPNGAPARRATVRLVVVNVVQPAADEIHRKREQSHLHDRSGVDAGVGRVEAEEIHQRQHGPHDRPADLDEKTMAAIAGHIRTYQSSTGGRYLLISSLVVRPQRVPIGRHGRLRIEIERIERLHPVAASAGRGRRTGSRIAPSRCQA